MIFLGERGQAKTRMIRLVLDLLDEWFPVVASSEVNDDPFNPVSKHAKDLIAAEASDTPLAWVHRSKRYGEKLATLDTSIADLIGEVDPIKVAEGRYLSDELTIHYGLVPRTDRGVFAINELPDLAERIQVRLLNVLEERDVQIRGRKIRLPLDILLFASCPGSNLLLFFSGFRYGRSESGGRRLEGFGSRGPGGRLTVLYPQMQSATWSARSMPSEIS